jgi:VWFA-related protein
MSRRLMTILMLVVALTSLGASPVDDDKKPKRKKFGSSLKQLRWDPAKQTAVEINADNRGDSSSNETIKLETLLVVLDMLVLEPGSLRYVTNLKKEDFMITEDGQPQQVAAFALGDGSAVPRSIILLIDWSGSQMPYLTTSIAAARTLISQLGPRDEMAIVTDDVELLVDFTGDRSKLNRALDSILKRHREERERGRSLQFTALFAALRELTVSSDRRTIIIFQTDGDEAPAFRDQPDARRFSFMRAEMPSDNYGLGDIFATAERTRATIYSVITNERLVGIPQGELYQRGAALLARRGYPRPGIDAGPQAESLLRLYTDLFSKGQLACVRVAERTGGWTAWLDSPERAPEIYSRILSDINNRYIIGYYPTNTDRDGRLRKVQVEVRGHPEYRVHGRSSYYAPGG